MRISPPRDWFALGLLLLACPFLLFPTVWLPGTAVALLLLAFIALLPLLTHHRPILPVTPLNLPILLWLVGLGVTALVTADPHKTLPQFTRFMVGLLFFYLLVASVRQRSRLNGLALGLIALGALFALIAPVAVAWNETKGVPIPDAIYQLFPLLSPDTIHPNIMAALMILLLPLPLAYFLSAFPHRPTWSLWLAISGWMGIVLLLTKSRGGYLAAVLAVILLLWLLRRRWLAVGLAGVTAVAALWLFVPMTAAPPATADLTNPSTFAFRLDVWRVALWMISDFPFTGAGLGAFNDVGMRLYPFAENNNPGAHNIFLQVGVDLGIPGLIVYLAWLLLALTLASAALRRATAQADNDLQAMMAGALAGLVGYSLHGLVDNGLWSTQVAFVPWLLIALIVQGHQLVKQNQADDKFSTLC